MLKINIGKGWLFGSILLLGYWFSTALIIVNERDYAIISQFGRPVKLISNSGLAFKLPIPFQTVTYIDKRTQLLSLETAEFGTRDRRNIVVDSFVVWRIADPMQYQISLRSLEATQLHVQAVVNSAVGSAIANINIEDIFSDNDHRLGLDELFSEITEFVSQQTYRESGVEVLSVRPKRFGYPSQNLQALYDRMESEWERLAKQYRAEGEEHASKINAETEREVSMIIASAEREAQLTRGEGEAKAAMLYADAFESHVEYYKFTRSMEAYHAMFNENTKLILPTDAPIFETLMNPNFKGLNDESTQ